LGAEQAVEKRICRRRFWPRAVCDEHGAHAESCGGRRRRTRMIGLNAASRDQRVGTVRLRACGDQRELAGLVFTEPARNRIVALDEQTRAAPERITQPRQRLDGRRRSDQRQHRKPRDRVPQSSQHHPHGILELRGSKVLGSRFSGLGSGFSVPVRSSSSPRQIGTLNRQRGTKNPRTLEPGTFLSVASMDLLSALRASWSVRAAELRPPRAELARAEGMDAWIDTYHAVQRLTRQGTFVFLTDSAVGTDEEDNLRHLVINLGN